MLGPLSDGIIIHYGCNDCRVKINPNRFPGAAASAHFNVVIIIIRRYEKKKNKPFDFVYSILYLRNNIVVFFFFVHVHRLNTVGREYACSERACSVAFRYNDDGNIIKFYVPGRTTVIPSVDVRAGRAEYCIIIRVARGEPSAENRVRAAEEIRVDDHYDPA